MEIGRRNFGGNKKKLKKKKKKKRTNNMWCKALRRKKKKRKNKTVGRYIIQVDLFLIQWIFDGSRYVLSSQRSIFPFLSLDWFIYNIVQTSSLMQYYIVVNNTQTPCRTQSELNMTRDRGEKTKICYSWWPHPIYLLGPIIWMAKSYAALHCTTTCVIL